jgi:hypothetical protein
VASYRVLSGEVVEVAFCQQVVRRECHERLVLCLELEGLA